MRNGHIKPRQRDSLPYASRKGLYASQINAARRQPADRQPYFHPNSLPAKHQPNTHLNPSRSRAKTAAGLLTRERNPARQCAVANPPDTHTHMHGEASSRTYRRNKNTSCQTTSDQHSMHRIPNHITNSSPNGAPPHRKSPTPNPASPRDESTQRRHKPAHARRAPPELPKQAHSAHL
jgi:hypothetical protein